MNKIKMVAIVAALVGVSGCEISKNHAFDGGIDRKNLIDMKAGIWVDPHGCDHWIIDDGSEGYMSRRLDVDGNAVCSGVTAPNHATDGYKRGSLIPDVI